MLLFLHHEDDIARNRAGRFVRLASEHDFLVVHHAFLDVHLQDLLFLDNLLGMALAALVFFGNHLARSAALVAHGLHLLHHAWRNLPHHQTHAAALARTAVPRRAALAALAVALGAKHVLREGQLLRHAVVQFLQAHLQPVHHVFAFSLALPLAAPAAAAPERVPSEHLFEDVER